MAILKERLKRRNESGGYDTIYLETGSSLVIMSDGTTLETKFNELSNKVNNIPSGPALGNTTPLINGTASAGTASTASRSDHIHPTDTTRAASSHNHGAGNITSGTLIIARGGTGLTASPSMLTNLASTTAADILVASPRPGVTGTLPLANGGTGQSTAPLALYHLINGSSALAATGLADTDVIPIGDVSAATGKNVTLANLSSYINAKSSGLTNVTAGEMSGTTGSSVTKNLGFKAKALYVEFKFSASNRPNQSAGILAGSSKTINGTNVALSTSGIITLTLPTDPDIYNIAYIAIG